MTARCKVGFGPLVVPVLGRLVMSLAAAADIPVDRADELRLAVEVLGSMGPSASPGDHLELVGKARDGRLELSLGPFKPDIVDQMLRDRDLPSPGALLELAAHRIWITKRLDQAFLHAEVCASVATV